LRKVSSSSAICDVKPDLITKKIGRKMPEKYIVFGCNNFQKSDSTAFDTCYVMVKRVKVRTKNKKLKNWVDFVIGMPRSDLRS